MNNKSYREFTVWDNEKLEVIIEDPELESGFVIDSKGKLFTVEYGELDGIDNDRFKVCRDIGIKDKNDKQIFALISIVQFDQILSPITRKVQKYRGYFCFNYQSLRYEIKSVETDETIYLWTGYCEENIEIADIRRKEITNV